MYRIYKKDGTEVGVTDAVTYIKIGASGDYACATQEDAAGVAFDGVAYNLIGHEEIDGDEVAVQEVDGGQVLTRTITLTASGWSSNTQTVTVSGVVALETAQLITPTPAIASQSAYYEAGIMCTNQGTNSLTFTCQTVPTSNLTVYVVIQPLG